MTSNAAGPAQAPTLQQLNRATLGAFAVAMVLLFIAVMPAEYGRDPTGIGRLLGLTPMGEMKAADLEAEQAPIAVATAPSADVTAPEPAIIEPAPAAVAAVAPQPVAAPVAKVDAQVAPAPKPATAPAKQRGEVTLTLAPNEGREVKALMKTGESFTYSWKTDGAEVRFDFHGDNVDAGNGEFTSYEKGRSTGQSGSFEAPFNGTHGWYWRNRTDKPVTITVTANGTFERLSLMP